MPARPILRSVVSLTLFLVAIQAVVIRTAHTAVAQKAVAQKAVAQDAQTHFHRGYYLQQEKGEIAAALAAYESALAAHPDQATRRSIRKQIDAIQEEIASRDLARLMPADALAYVEFARPADHLEKLLRSMGLVDHQPSGERVLLPLDDGLALPSDFQFSDELLEELKKIHGFAVAVNEIDFQRERPIGVAVVHMGKSNLLQGLIETGVQIVPRADSIAGHPTYCIDGEVWLAKTNSLLIVSTQRDQVEAALMRLKSSGDSLASSENFRKCKADRQDAMIFAYVDGPTVMSKYGAMMTGEAAVARMVLGLDHLQQVTIAIGATDNGAAAQLKCAFDENQQSLAYGLIRTVPLKDATLRRIPAGAAIVAVLGVNPQLGMLAGAADAPKQITGLDLGRELFANIKDVGLFVIPSVAKNEIPDFGITISSHDAEKSELLWNQMLTLSSQIEESGVQAEDISIQGRSARRYTFPDDDAPELVVLRLDDETMVVGTETAVSSAADADGGNSVLEDESLARLVGGRSEHTCKAIFAHGGRLLKLASMIHGEDQQEIEMAQKVLRDAHLSLVSEESPTEFKLRIEVNGLPRFENIVKTVAAAHGNRHHVARVEHARHSDYDRHETDSDTGATEVGHGDK